jgi:flagellar basal-body rod protein FlgF/flagellar basal-body rod protein FlgG
MAYGLYLSAAGANAQNHKLEVVSHNLANVNTPGFKPHLAVIKSRNSEAVERGDVPGGTGGVDDIGGSVTVAPSVTQVTQGPIRKTGGNSDFAINDDKSFFVIQRGDQKLLTRAGNFTFDATGKLVTPVGETVLSENGGPIVVNPLLPFKVTDDGAVYQAGQRQNLMLAQPQETGDLSRVGDNLYQSLSELTIVPANERKVVGGAVEQSAVKPMEAMVELINTSRAYEANVRMIQTQDQTIGSLISRVLSE